MTPAARFSTILVDFLSSDIAIAAGAPALADLPRRSMTAATQITHPHVIVHVEEDPDSGDALLNLKLELRHKSQIGAEADLNTTRSTAHTQLQALRALLADTAAARAAWDAWIVTQTEDYRDGWSLQQIWPQTVTTEHDAEKNILTLTAPYDLITFWNS